MALTIDAVIILLYFAAITAIGLYMGRRERSLHDFALGGRSVPWWAVMASIIAAETSAATFLGIPGEGFEKRSLAYVQLVAGIILGRVIVGCIFLRPYYQYKVYTVYDYLGVRFGPRSKNFVSALFLVMRTLASGTRLFVPALVMVLAWRMLSGGRAVEFSTASVSGVAPYVAAIAILTLLTCLYTAAGGIKAVIWTDVIQASLMAASAAAAIVTLLYHLGGSWNLLRGLEAVGRAAPEMTQVRGYFITGLERETVAAWQQANGIGHMGAWEYLKLILASEYTIFSALIGFTFVNMASFGTDQDMVQRMLTATDHRKSRRSLLSAALTDVPIYAMFSFIGVLLFAYAQSSPGFLPRDGKGQVVNSDVFGSYILQVMPAGLRGLVLAGIFATAMGSLSAALNALATSFTNDWYIPYLARGRSERHYVNAARLFTAAFAGVMVAIASAFAYAKVHDPGVRIIPVVMGIAAFILGPMLGVFLVGMLTRRRGSDRGNTIAIVAGLATTIVLGGLHIDLANLAASLLGLGTRYTRPDWLPKIAFTWFAMLGAGVVFGVGICFRTPARVLEEARARAEQAQAGDDRPIALRDGR